MEARIRRIGGRHTGQGGDVAELMDIEEEDELDSVTDQYVGPSALCIANLIPGAVKYRQGWFWTTTAICHGGDSQGLAFRQRPDGNGIDVRCHTGGCSRGVTLDGLETATGVAIRSAYAPTARSVDRFNRLTQTLVWWGTAALLFAVTLLLGLGLQAAILTWLGYGIGGLLIGTPLPRRLARRSTR